MQFEPKVSEAFFINSSSFVAVFIAILSAPSFISFSISDKFSTFPPAVIGTKHFFERNERVT